MQNLGQRYLMIGQKALVSRVLTEQKVQGLGLILRMTGLKEHRLQTQTHKHQQQEVLKLG